MSFELPLFTRFIEYLNYLLCSVFSFIYDLIFSKPVTGFTYCRLLNRLKSTNISQIHSILDVGVGTGTALNYVISEIPKDVKIMGVDIDEHYVKTCQKLFEKRPNVSIELQNFYEFEVKKGEEKFDVILFTSSFMLMPDQNQALQVAKKILKPNGKVYFILTLFEKRKRLISIFKPLLKYVLTVDFGQAMTEEQFLDILKQNDMKVTYKERVIRKYIPCFRVFRYFLVEAEFTNETSAQ